MSWKNIIEILFLFLFIYPILNFIKGSRGEGIFRGVTFLFFAGYGVVFYIAKYFQLEQLNYILSNFLPTYVFALIIIFQPEIRRGLVRLGQTPLLDKIIPLEDTIIEEILKATLRMSRNRIGAIIAIEREVGLRSYVEGGVLIQGLVSSELLETIFYPGTALHDGAVIISEEQILAASCLFPLTESGELAKGLGTRHRAGIGVTEESDAIVIIVSEETGAISLAHRGELHKNLDKDSLKKLFTDLYLTK
ncbi:MAG: TIGR00159 family protein [Planctomycetota bacterium]|nr:MAG: TIGR00159 family protein [Planctomycetota bacterium]